MVSYKSSISAGLLVYDLLSQSEAVMRLATKVYPVTATAGVRLPYVSYRRTKTDVNPVKAGHGAETVHIEVNCYASNYKDCVSLAEAVRETLDHASADQAGLVLRSCSYEDSAEGYEDDAFIQSLVFTLKI